jgi:hypothetical protein
MTANSFVTSMRRWSACGTSATWRHCQTRSGAEGIADDRRKHFPLARPRARRTGLSLRRLCPQSRTPWLVQSSAIDTFCRVVAPEPTNPPG